METKQNFKERYDFICCKCGYEQWAKPSIMMAGFGINSGCGSCLNCKQFLHLKIEGGLDGENMVSELWDDFLKRKGVIQCQDYKQEKTEHLL